MPFEADRLLLPYLQAKTDRDARQHLSVLIEEHAIPVVTETIAHHFRTTIPKGGFERQQDVEAEEARGSALWNLMARLDSSRTGGADPIEDFLAYTATVSKRACDDVLRQKYPNRYRLTNRLRYLLTHDPRLAMWPGARHQTLTGLVKWRDRTQSSAALSEPLEIAGNARLWAAVVDRDRTVAEVPFPNLVYRLYTRIGQPVGLGRMVTLLAAILEIEDHPPQTSAPDPDADILDNVPSNAVSVHDQVQSREYFRRLWKEVLDLPPQQRSAILLNLRGSSKSPVLDLLPAMGIASIRQIAEAVGLSAEEFGELWGDLPIGDARIAEILTRIRQEKTTGQDVINFRKAGRMRLARRMKPEEKE